MPETRPRQRSAKAPPTSLRVFLLTDLSRRSGRQLSVALEEKLRASASAWRLSTRHSADLSPVEIANLPSDAMIVDQVDDDRLTAAQQSCQKLISLSDRKRPGLATLRIDPALAGAVSADILLRRGHRSFLIAPTVHAEFMTAFVDEIAHAGLTASAMRTATAAANLSDTTVVAETVRHSPESQMQTMTRIEIGPTSERSVLSIEPSIASLTLILAQWLANDQQPLPAIPPHPVADSVIAALPDAFGDPAIAAVSSYVDAKLSRGEACKIDAIASHFSLARRTLERRFRDIAKTSIHKEITRRQVARARQNLFEPGATPATAASASGYPNTRMLSINFRKLIGLSPRQYQRTRILPAS